MISPTRSAIGSPARDPPLCDVLQRVSITPYPTISTRSPTGSKSEPQTGQDPRSDRLRFPRCVARLARQTFEMQHRQALLVVGSRQIRVAGMLGPTGSALVRVPSTRRAFRRRWASITDETRWIVRSRLRSPRLRTGRSRVLRVMVLGPSRPSVGSARKEEGKNPRAFNQIGTQPPSRWSNAGRRALRPRSQNQ
jgi:hypothetical protein